jgi:hypothetical protein
LEQEFAAGCMGFEIKKENFSFQLSAFSAFIEGDAQ